MKNLNSFLMISGRFPLPTLALAFVLLTVSAAHGQRRPAPKPSPTPSVEETGEDLFWKEIFKRNTVEGYESYLREYPSGRYTLRAREGIKAAKKAEDKRAWQRAASLKTVEAYQGYLRSYPVGEFASLARLRLGDLGVKVAPAGDMPGAVRKNSIGMELVYIPAGEFMMGSSDAEKDAAWGACKIYYPSCERSLFDSEGPQRRVTFAEGFWMGKYEVTKGQWQSVMGNNPSKFSNCGADCPVENVSWNDAKEFIAKLNAQNDGLLYSLPTEAQWEYAARAGTTTAFAFGDSLSSTQANFDGNYPYGNAPKGPYLQRTAKVGSYSPNAWGLYDMHGNVWEWVEDWYTNSYSGLPSDGSANLTMGEKQLRVLRGGSGIGYGSSTRSAVRLRHSPTERHDYDGFRVAARPK